MEPIRNQLNRIIRDIDRTLEQAKKQKNTKSAKDPFILSAKVFINQYPKISVSELVSLLRRAILDKKVKQLKNLSDNRLRRVVYLCRNRESRRLRGIQ